MSAPEPTTAAPVEEVKPTDTTPAVETSKVEEPAAVAEVVAPAVEATPATDAEPAATEEPPKEEAKPEAKEAASKGNFLSKLFGSMKVGGEKVKGLKSPKKDTKKKEDNTPAAEVAPVTEAPEAPAVEVTEPAKDDVTPVTEVTEPPKETEPAAASVPAPVPMEDKAKEEKAAVPKAELKALKVGRRLSARVGDLFKSKPKSEVQAPAKVDENPPMIDEPPPVAPLENPASEAVPEAKVEESVKPAEVTTPVIAATA